jgi:diacylglycerol kinase (CTP)
MINRINHLELKRKILHILVGMTALLLLIYNIITPLIIFIILTIGIFVSLLSLRIKIPIISWFLDNFERNKDKNRLPGRGIIFAVAGSLLALQLFERNIALASIMILTFSDSTSLLIGKYFGKTKSVLNQNKNIEGTIAGILISSIFACFFVPFYLAFVGSLIVGIFELLTIRIQNIKIDDNLIIPLAAGTAMSLILRFLI